jgi:hypothetical protein
MQSSKFLLIANLDNLRYTEQILTLRPSTTVDKNTIVVYFLSLNFSVKKNSTK